MSPEDFMEYWERSYATPPLGRLLRDRYHQDRWLRVHSLPESKRYADNEEEHREILVRQNTVISEQLGEGTPCHLVFGYYGEQVGAELEARLRDLNPVFLTTLSARDSGLVDEFPLLHASLIWKAGCLDAVLRAVADDILTQPLLVGIEQRCVLAPYDGGMDIIVRDRTTRGRLKQRYSSWLSQHPKGL